MISLETPRLILRNFRPEDAAPLREYALQYTASPMGMYDYAWSTGPQEIQNTVREFAASDSFIAVCLKETGQYIGFVDLVRTGVSEKLPTFELGYGFLFNYHGQGYASEACETVVRYAFETLNAQRLESGTAQVNLPSQRVLEKLGFVKTSEEQVSFQSDARGNPFVFTGFLYELTRQQWEENQA